MFKIKKIFMLICWVSLFSGQIKVNAQGAVIKTDYTWKVLRSQTEPAGNWKNYIFDESAWSNAYSVPLAQCLTQYSQYPANDCSTVSTPIWADLPNGVCSVAGGSNGDDIVFFRKKFSIVEPDGTYCSYSLFVKVNDASEIFINGQSLGTTEGNWFTGTLFIIPPSLLKFNSNKNVIAVKATDRAATAWFSAVLCKGCN